jgi:hypothetical protein
MSAAMGMKRMMRHPATSVSSEVSQHPSVIGGGDRRKESRMRTNPPAGKPAAPPMLLNVPRLMTTYYRGAGVKLEVDPLGGASVHYGVHHRRAQAAANGCQTSRSIRRSAL